MNASIKLGRSTRRRYVRTLPMNGSRWIGEKGQTLMSHWTSSEFTFLFSPPKSSGQEPKAACSLGTHARCGQKEHQEETSRPCRWSGKGPEWFRKNPWACFLFSLLSHGNPQAILQWHEQGQVTAMAVGRYLKLWGREPFSLTEETREDAVNAQRPILWLSCPTTWPWTLAQL